MCSRIAIVVSYYINRLDADERTSLRHLTHFLSNWDTILLTPEGLEISSLGSFRIQRFPAEYFTGTAAYSRLLLSTGFYQAFRDYETILIYQLDCLAFTSDIQPWLAAGYDYIGAPWFNDPQHAESGISRVGNGGLSLRRVDSFLKVLNSPRIPLALARRFTRDLKQPRIPLSDADVIRISSMSLHQNTP